MDYGYLIGLNELQERLDSLKDLGISLGLAGLLLFARSAGATHLRLDPDGPVIEGLTVFEW